MATDGPASEEVVETCTELLLADAAATHVSLSLKGLRCEGVAALEPTLLAPACAALTSLDVSCNSIGPSGCEAIARIIAGHPSLHTVNLSANPIDDDGAYALARELRRPDCKLRDLDVHSCCIHDVGGVAVANACRENTSLLSLNLRANYLTDACLESVTMAVTENSTLKAVNLHSNDFTPPGFERLQSLVATHASITDVGSAGPALESLCCVS